MSKIWPSSSPLRAIERRLARARPRPDRRFVRQTGRVLGARWAAVDRPAALRLQVLGLFVAGVALLAIAALIGLS